MFTIGNATVRNCNGYTRREMLRVGGLSLAGLTLADWFRSTSAAPGEPRRESACIFLWLDGGPRPLWRTRARHESDLFRVDVD